MTKKIMESLNYLIEEYKRLKKKKEKNKLTSGELETFKKLEPAWRKDIIRWLSTVHNINCVAKD